MKKILSLLLVYFILVTQCFAITGVPDNPHWVYAGFGGAGTYSMVVPDHFTANKLYLIPDVNAPYVSTDGSDTWNFLSYNSPSFSNFGPTQTAAFVQSKVNANLMYAIDSSNAGLYKSIDGGQKWVKKATYRQSKGNKVIAIDPNDDNTVYVGTIANGAAEGGRVYRTTDGGETWALLFRPFDVSVTSESAELTGSAQTRTGRLNNLSNILKGSVVFTSASGETFTDNGSGVLVSNMGGSGTINYINANDTSANGSYGKYSLTFGTTPSTTTVNYTVSANFSFVYVTPDSANIVVGRGASSGTTLVKYNIAGNTITPITLIGTNATYNVDYGTYIDGSAVENLCVTAGNKISCSSDLSTWNDTSALTTGSTYRINHFAVTRLGGTLKFVATRALLTNDFATVTHYSGDAGVTWATSTLSINNTMNPTGVYNAGTPRIFSIAFDPFDSTKVYATSDWRHYKSVNSGASFNEKVSGAPMIVAHDVTVSPNGKIFVASMDTGLQSSTDFGVTWTQNVPNATQRYVTGSVNDYGGHYWRVKTLGTKAQWDAGTGVVIALATMYSSPASINYVNFVIRSTDSGATWSRSNLGLPTILLGGDTVWYPGFARAIGVSKDESTIYIAIDGERTDITPQQFGGLFKSTDVGVTWTRVWSLPRKVFNALAVDPTDATNQKLLLGTCCNNSYNLYQKTGASTANYVGDSFGPGNAIVDAAYDSAGRPYVVVPGNAIYKSIVTAFGPGTGSYGTWRLMKRFPGNGLADGLVIDPQNNNRIFVAITEGSPLDRKIYVTADAQNHDTSKWYDITGDFPVVGGCRALTLSYFEGNQGTLYCASNGAGLWKLDLTDSPSSHPNRTYFGGGGDE